MSIDSWDEELLRFIAWEKGDAGQVKDCWVLELNGHTASSSQDNHANYVNSDGHKMSHFPKKLKKKEAGQ